MEGIQFIAKMGNWVAVRKLSVEEKTEPLMVMEFIAGLSVSFDRKIEEFLAKEVEIEKLNTAIDEELEGIKKGARGVSEVLAKIGGAKLGRVINELCDSKARQPKEKKELKEFCKIFALRKAFRKLGLKVDYSTIETPAIKAAMKKAKKKNKQQS